MSTRRVEGTDRCPLDEERLTLAVCVGCRYFRGASFDGRERAVVCNWPRDGQHLDRRPIPRAFSEAFDG